MKKTTALYAILALLLFTPIFLSSQNSELIYFEYTFEPGEYLEDADGHYLNTYQYIEFDTTSLWQIGQPQKAEWDSAYRGKYVLMTDTVNYLKQPTKASFTFKHERPFYMNYLMAWYISMPHVYDLPINTAGVYVEVSYTHGASWLQVIEDTLPCYYFEDDGLICPKPYVFDYFYEYTLENFYVASGEKKDWGGDYVILSKDYRSDKEAAKITSVWLRFTYNNTDTVSHKGWMIDDLIIAVVQGYGFFSVNEKGLPLANLYPNPVVGQSVIAFENISRQEWQLNVYNMLGKLVVSEQTCNEYFTLNKTQFAKGSYVYQLTSNNKTMATGKFLVE